MNIECMKVIETARSEAKDFGEPAIVYWYRFKRSKVIHYSYCMEANFISVQEILGVIFTRIVKIMPDGKMIQ